MSCPIYYYVHEYHIAVIKETCITLACFEDAVKLRQPEPPSLVALQNGYVAPIQICDRFAV